jgi:hypothetical protein
MDVVSDREIQTDTVRIRIMRRPGVALVKAPDGYDPIAGIRVVAKPGVERSSSDQAGFWNVDVGCWCQNRVCCDVAQDKVHFDADYDFNVEERGVDWRVRLHL